MVTCKFKIEIEYRFHGEKIVKKVFGPSEGYYLSNTLAAYTDQIERLTKILSKGYGSVFVGFEVGNKPFDCAVITVSDAETDYEYDFHVACRN